MGKHKTFISFHSDDEWAKKHLEELNKSGGYFVNKSVTEGDIDDSFPDEKIRKTIRDDFLGDTTVTILLVGRETKTRKFIDWELHASMLDTDKNPKSGIVCVNLPSISQSRRGTTTREKELINPNGNWTTVDSRSELESNYPFMPSRIIDNFSNKVDIAVVDWKTIENNIDILIELIDIAYEKRKTIKYDTRALLRRRNSL